MAEKIEPKETVSLEDLAISNSFEIAALVSVLERKGLLTREEVIEEIKRMQKSSNSTRSFLADRPAWTGPLKS